MNVETLLTLCVVGKTLIYTAQKFPPFKKIKSPFWQELFNCDFCLGVWVFTILSTLLRQTLFTWYCPLVSELATGTILSLVVHIFSIGWQDKFGTIRVD
jgi:hypothetical protein